MHKHSTDTETQKTQDTQDAQAVDGQDISSPPPSAENKVSEPSGENAPSLEERLQQAERKAEENRDAWLRAKAEVENTRRRAQDDISKATKFAVERFAGELLPVKDSLEAALAVETPGIESLKSGTELTLKQLATAFEKSGLKEVCPLNEKFNPNFHQAISTIESDQEPNTVVSVLQKGYLLADRVLRPALVVVAKVKT